MLVDALRLDHHNKNNFTKWSQIISATARISAFEFQILVGEVGGVPIAFVLPLRRVRLMLIILECIAESYDNLYSCESYDNL